MPSDSELYARRHPGHLHNRSHSPVSSDDDQVELLRSSEGSFRDVEAPDDSKSRRKRLKRAHKQIIYLKKFRPKWTFIMAAMGMVLGAVTFIILAVTPTKKAGLKIGDKFGIGFGEFVLGAAVGLLIDVIKYAKTRYDIRSMNLDTKVEKDLIQATAAKMLQQARKNAKQD